MKNPSYLSVYEDGAESSETSAYKIQTPGNYPEESIQQMSVPSSRVENSSWAAWP